MRVLFATAELAPLARVGGLAEATSGLVRALRATGVQVDVVLPDYANVELGSQVEVDVEVPEWVGKTRVRQGIHAHAGQLTLVQVPGIERPHPYVDDQGQGWPDNDRRFMAFSAVVAALAVQRRPDVIHLNDWHTAAVTTMLVDPAPMVLTVHTLGYQGTMDRSWLDRMPVQTHRFAWHECTNPLAGAIECVDRVIAVSPNYAAEIVTEAGGMGLDQRLAALGDRLVGIRNGIDATAWNPATDPHIAATYDPDNLETKDLSRAALIDEIGWTHDRTPIAAMVTRLVDQKGLDLVLDIVRFLPNMSLRLAVLGSGSAELADALSAAALNQPDRVWFSNGYDEALGHRLFAGSDLFVMPSRFEPCGLAQMQAMTYGSIPVVSNVGGLHDTVIDADLDRANGTGFVATSLDSAGLVDALHRAVRAVGHSRRRGAIARRGMNADWSWTEPAQQHIALYQAMIAERR